MAGSRVGIRLAGWLAGWLAGRRRRSTAFRSAGPSGTRSFRLLVLRPLSLGTAASSLLSHGS